MRDSGLESRNQIGGGRHPVSPQSNLVLGLHAAQARFFSMLVPALLLAFPLFPMPAHATSALALYTKTLAVIAADGRVNVVGPEVMSHSNECKIGVANGMAGAASGLTKQDGVDFDVTQMLNSALRQSGSPYEAADTAETTIERALPAALREFQKNNPDQFERRSPGGLQILVVGLSGAGEVQVARRFIPYDPARTVQRENTSGNDERVGVALIGETSAIDRELDRLHDTNAWAGKNDPTNLVNMARRFIALEIVDKPKQVGPPVSMVSIGRDGTHWVERGACGP